LLSLACRYSEAAELRWDQVDLELQTVNLKRSKTNNESCLLMDIRLYKVLKRRFETRTQDKWVFTDKSGKNPRKHSTISIRKAIKNAGIDDFRVHDLRHSAATK